MLEAHILQHGQGPRSRVAVRHPSQQQRYRRVVLGGQARGQLEILKHEAKLRAPVGQYVSPGHL